MDLLSQLNAAMEYIEANIADDANLADVAKVTDYSPYHFARMFNYIADMPLSEYIRKRKMSLAAMELQRGNVKIIDLALKYGYDSPDSFTRAFVKQHGIAPSQVRTSGATLTIYPALTFQIQIMGVQKMNWRIEERDAFSVFGVERIFENDGINHCPELWAECHRNGEYERLFDAAQGRRYPDGHGYPNADGSCLIGAVCGYGDPSDDSWRYMIGAPVTKNCNTDGFAVAQIPKCTWALFRSEETTTVGEEIPRLFHRAYKEWLPSSDYCKGNGPDLEVYGVGENGKYWEEVWIPVEIAEKR